MALGPFDALQTPDHPFGLVVLDVGLPDLNGFRSLSTSASTPGSIPVIFLTARSDEIDRIVGLEIGAD